MGKKKKLLYQQAGCSSGSDSFDSDSSDEQPQLDAGRYQAAQLPYGLQDRALRLAAIKELQEVFRQGLYSAADKKLQHAIFEDLLVAAQQRDRRVKVQEATSALLSAAKRILPQQKRNLLVKEEKQAAVAASRAARKEASAAGGQAVAAASHRQTSRTSMNAEQEEEDEDSVVFDDMPLEVVGVILQSLDPLSLALAACVCRSWYKLATQDELWRGKLHSTFPKATKRQQQQQPGHCPSDTSHQEQQSAPQPEPGLCPVSLPPQGGAGAAHRPAHRSTDVVCPGRVYRDFAAEARRQPDALLPWRSCRALRYGRLEWLLPATSAPSAGSAAGAAAAIRQARQGATPPGPLYLTPTQAVQWMMRRPLRQIIDVHQPAGSSSSGGDSSSDESEGEGSFVVPRTALKLWSIGGRLPS